MVMNDCKTAIDRITKELEEERAERRAEESGHKQQRGKQQYGKLLDSLPDALVLVDPEGKIVHINARLETMFGYTKGELIGENLEILMPQRFRTRHRSNVASYMANPRIRPMGSGLELFGMTKNGTEFPVDISLSYLTVEGELLAVAAIRDITDRKNSERKIELNYRIQKAISSVLKISLEPMSIEEQLGRVLDLILAVPGFAPHSRGSIYLVDEESGTLVLKAMHGFSVAQVESCKTVPLRKGPADDRVSACTVVGAGCLEGRHEIQYVMVENSEQYCVPIVFGEKALGLINVAVMEGHTRNPEEEEFLAALANSLAGLIVRQQAEATKNNLRERLAESEKFSALGRITANVAHTIKNPLTVIGGFAERLHDTLTEGTKEKKFAGLILSESMRLERILRNVLLLSRGPSALQREAYDLSVLAESTLSPYEELLRERSILIEKSYGSVPVVRGSKDQVRQAIENLIANAVEAMPEGGTLTVITATDTVNGIPYATVKVKDTGEGISPENRDKIFEPFFSTKVDIKGTGLGLSITKKIVEDHGGFIRVESEGGTGATFSLYFP